VKKELAIIGYGRFGRLAADLLKKEFRVFVTDIRRNFKPEAGIRKTSLSEAASKPTIIIAVPINRLPTLLTAIAPLVKPGTLVCDVCSVKELPVLWMKKLLPAYVLILGTHPLFGPDSATAGVAGKTIIVCPVRIRRQAADHIQRRLTQLGLVVRRMTPSHHDRLMASTLFLTQYIGRGLRPQYSSERGIETQSFQLLQRVIQLAGNDSMELFQDMYAYNRYAKTIPTQVMLRLKSISDSLTSE